MELFNELRMPCSISDRRKEIEKACPSRMMPASCSFCSRSTKAACSCSFLRACSVHLTLMRISLAAYSMRITVVPQNAGVNLSFCQLTARPHAYTQASKSVLLFLDAAYCHEDLLGSSGRACPASTNSAHRRHAALKFRNLPRTHACCSEGLWRDCRAGSSSGVAKVACKLSQHSRLRVAGFTLEDVENFFTLLLSILYGDAPFCEQLGWNLKPRRAAECATSRDHG